jgi:hypothetical protein
MRGWPRRAATPALEKGKLLPHERWYLASAVACPRVHHDMLELWLVSEDTVAHARIEFFVARFARISCRARACIMPERIYLVNVRREGFHAATWSLSFSAPTKAASSCPSGPLAEGGAWRRTGARARTGGKPFFYLPIAKKKSSQHRSHLSTFHVCAAVLILEDSSERSPKLPSAPLNRHIRVVEF